jgi:predicted  nucleic acid-binding Zn-ribbon protein
MKQSIFTLGILFALTTANAQNIVVSEGSSKFSTGNQNALSVTVLENTKSNVEDKWKSFIKNFKNEAIKSSKGELLGDNVVLPDWGNNPVDIYTTFEEDKKLKKVVMHVAFDLGGTYLKSADQKDKYTQAEKMVKDFAIKTSADAVTDKIKDQEKKLTDLQDKQAKLEKKNSNLKDDITKNETKITIAKNEITSLDGDIVKKKSEIDAQKRVVEASAGAVEKQAKSATKIYDDLKGQLEDLEKKKKNHNTDIKDCTKKISKLKEEISKNENEQSVKKTEISNATRLVDETKATLNKIN